MDRRNSSSSTDSDPSSGYAQVVRLDAYLRFGDDGHQRSRTGCRPWRRVCAGQFRPFRTSNSPCGRSAPSANMCSGHACSCRQ